MIEVYLGPVKWGFETLGKRGGEESGHDIWNKRKKKFGRLILTRLHHPSSTIANYGTATQWAPAV